MVLRPFRDDDYPRMVQISNRIYTDYVWSEREFRHKDETWDLRRYVKLRLVAEADGHIVGFGQFNHMAHQFNPRKYALDIQVDPEHQRRGVGTRLYEHLVTELRGREAMACRTAVKESMASSVAFVQRRGFVEVQRAWESRLDVGAFDFAPFAGAEERAAAQGIMLTTFAAESARDPDAPRNAYDLHSACMRDVPSVDPVTDVPYEHYVARELEPPNALPDGHFIAKDGERWAGESQLFRSLEDPEILYQGLTGLLREYRGRGIAMALKLQTVRFARAHGYREIRTWNDTRNGPMLRINEALGFAKQPVWISFEKSLA